MGFALTCYGCDAGDRWDSRVAAECDGWQKVEPAADGLPWTWVGWCPRCWPAACFGIPSALMTNPHPNYSAAKQERQEWKAK